VQSPFAIWFALGFLEALECGMLVRSGEDPSTTSSSANWERTDDDMDRLEAGSEANSRPECVPEDAHYVPVTHCNPWYIRAISAPPGGLEPPAYGLEVRRATTP
jgi:hypothetical protein